MNLRLRAGWSALALGFGLAGGASPAASQDDLPPPAPDCYITGGGLITVAGSDDKATFGITAADRAQIGQQQYRDHGPATEFTFHSVRTLVTLCTPTPLGPDAEISGVGVVRTQPGNVQETVQYRIRVRDGGEAQALDTFRLSLSNGYETTERPVLAGDIQVATRP